ncbi:hypothetical protein J2W42_006878 [Rhizobium tibeticum]|nr:hypothetical protein [Rhizobium tibeticum]
MDRYLPTVLTICAIAAICLTLAGIVVIGHTVAHPPL